MPDIGGVYTATSTSTVSFDDWWLEVIEDSSYNIILSVIDFKRASQEEQTKYHAMSRRFPIVVRGVIRGEEFDIKIEFLTVAAFNEFEAIRNLQRTVLLRRGYTGEQWYIDLGPNRPIEEAPSDHTYKVVNLTATEVDVPA
jgi:hypothetical protein